MESENVLTDDMNVCGPILLELLRLLVKRLIGIVAERSDIVGKSVQPYVNNVFIIKVYGDSPLEGGTGYAKILKSCLKEIIANAGK